jgi:hypothetical protein
MTQPNPGAPAEPNPTTPPAPATGPAAPTAPAQQPAPNPPQQTTTDGDPGDLGDAGKRAIAVERERAKAAERLASDLQKQLEQVKPAMDILQQLQKATTPADEKTELQKLQEQLAAVEKTAAEERLARLKLEVVQAKGLTPAHADWLRGSTAEELAASADALLALFPGAQPNGQQQPAGTPGGTPGTPRPDPTQGARGSAVADLQTQIREAESKGDVRTSILLKQQLAAQQRANQ